MKPYRVLVFRYPDPLSAPRIMVVSTHALARDAHREAARVRGWVG